VGERSDLPPRLRNWKEGTPQIGAFIRTRNGATVTLVNDSANEDQETLIFALVIGTKRMPPETMRMLRRWVDSQVERDKA
jgi:hypothetical protein